MAKDTNALSLREKFNQMFKTTSQSPTDINTRENPNIMYEYAQHELSVLISRNATKDRNADRDPLNIDTQTILSTFWPTHQELVSTVANAERLKALDGSLKQVENIIVSSIMSPNDLQDRDPTISLTTDEITDAQKNACIEILSDFYNKKYNLREKMEAWVKEAQFRSGASVTLTLPEASLASLINTYDPDRKIIQKSQECFSMENINKGYINNSDLSELESMFYTDDMLEKIKHYNPNKKSEYKYSTEGTSIIISNKEVDDTVVNSNVINSVFAELSEDIPKEVKNQVQLKSYLNALKSSIEAITINIKTLLKKKNISTNPEIARFGKNYQDYLKEQTMKNVSSLFENQYKENKVNVKNNYISIIDLSEHMTSYKDQRAYPFSINIPTEAVIPICVPGSKKEHIAYAILIDKYGRPIEASSYLVGDSGCSISGRINKAYTAMYGNVPTNSGIKSPNTAFTNRISYTIQNQQNRAIQKVFSYILDNLLRNTVTDSLGITDMEFSNYDSIATCMLTRLLEKKETSILFVPKRYITYVAFDYHSSGIGKSKIDDILFIESLKVSMQISNVLATMKNAVPYKKIVLNLSKEQRNPENLMTQIRNAVAEKERILPSIYPQMVAQQIMSQNMSIELTGPQTQDFKYEINDDKRELPTIDTDYLDKLDALTITSLGAPISAINEIAEVQYAKSIATTNIFFAKTISRDQDILTNFATEHIKTHLSLSSALLYQLAVIISNSDTDKKDELHNEVTPAAATDIENSLSKEINKEITPEQIVKQNNTIIGILGKKISEDTYLKVLKIIDSLEITLPAPLVAPDQSHYDMIDASIKLINDYVEAIFPDDLVPQDYEDLQKALKVLKADIKANAQKETANLLGLGGTLELIPDINTYSLDSRSAYNNFLGALRGFSESIKRDQQPRIAKNPEEDNSDSGSSSGFSF